MVSAQPGLAAGYELTAIASTTIGEPVFRWNRHGLGRGSRRTGARGHEKRNDYFRHPFLLAANCRRFGDYYCGYP
jgi:hypothetical protein